MSWKVGCPASYLRNAWLTSSPRPSSSAATGPFVQVSKLLGLPFARLRLALPEELHRNINLLHSMGLTQPLTATTAGAITGDRMASSAGGIGGLLRRKNSRKFQQSRIEMIIGLGGPLYHSDDEGAGEKGRLRRGRAGKAPTRQMSGPALAAPSGDDMVSTGTHYRAPRRAGIKFSPREEPSLKKLAASPGGTGDDRDQEQEPARLMKRSSSRVSVASAAAPQRRVSAISSVAGDSPGMLTRSQSRGTSASMPTIGGASTLRDGKIMRLEESMADGEWLVSTALMFAVLYHMRLLPFDKLAARERRAALLFNTLTQCVSPTNPTLRVAHHPAWCLQAQDAVQFCCDLSRSGRPLIIRFLFFVSPSQQPEPAQI